MVKKLGITTTRKLDAVDRQIIRVLREDGRMPFAQIAKRLGVSAGMVRQRYLQMVEDNVLHVVPVTNVTLLGYNMMAMIGVEVDGNRMVQIAHEIAAFEEVIYLVICTGTYDLLVEVVCQDSDHLLRFLTERLRSVPGVRSTETFTYLQIIKESYL
ncbi:MAG: Lrp/AsnC family transcriptional regulator [Anaerolineae bacterium]|jgi:Lrp/AsnC family transcriptional regulator for asnA, asnC and gidA